MPQTPKLCTPSSAETCVGPSPVFAPDALLPSIRPARKRHPPFDPSLLALKISGDCGGITYYQNKNHKTVAYPAAPALRPPSPLQQINRARFALGMQAWRMLTMRERAEYHSACDRLGLCMWGANLFLLMALSDPSVLHRTISHQTGTALAPVESFTSGALAEVIPAIGSGVPSPSFAKRKVTAWIEAKYPS